MQNENADVYKHYKGPYSLIKKKRLVLNSIWFTKKDREKLSSECKRLFLRQRIDIIGSVFVVILWIVLIVAINYWFKFRKSQYIARHRVSGYALFANFAAVKEPRHPCRGKHPQFFIFTFWSCLTNFPKMWKKHKKKFRKCDFHCIFAVRKCDTELWNCLREWIQCVWKLFFSCYSCCNLFLP